MSVQRSSIRPNRLNQPSRARVGRPPRRAAASALTPPNRGPTEPRERSYNQHLARQSPPQQENCWQFRVECSNLTGESAL